MQNNHVAIYGGKIWGFGHDREQAILSALDTAPDVLQDGDLQIEVDELLFYCYPCSDVLYYQLQTESPGAVTSFIVCRGEALFLDLKRLEAF